MTPVAPKKRYNLRDVAYHAGVSVATVSRVLNAPDRVAKDTRERVNSAITELRFVPSAAARAINSGRTKMVAALLPTLDNSIYARLVDGLEYTLSDFGLSLIVAQTCEKPEAELRRARSLLDIGAEGFVVAGVSQNQEFMDLIEHVQVPTVAISYFDPDNQMPTIGYDNRAAAELATRHLMDLGHREIAVIHGPLRYNDRTQTRRQALDAVAQQASFAFFETEMSVGGGCEAVRRCLNECPSATAILCFSDVLAGGVLSELQRLGKSVPQDFSVMGMEDLPSSSFTNPPLTSVRLRVTEMGERAAEALAGWVENQTKPDHIELGIELKRRASTGPARKG